MDIPALNLQYFTNMVQINMEQFLSGAVILANNENWSPHIGHIETARYVM